MRVVGSVTQGLASAVTVAGVYQHLVELQRIADRNGGCRASGTAGYEESVEYVVNRLLDADFEVSVPEFPITFAETVAERLSVAGETVGITVMRYSPDTPIGGVTGPLAIARGQGMEPADFAGSDFRGAIALIQRGGGRLAAKQRLAAEAGAIGAVIYNNNPEWLLGNLGSDADARIPTGGISQVDGQALLARAGAQVTLELRTATSPRTSRTVLAQTRTGRPDNVVMAGAHLDSVVDGPGINDAGTGCAALLETALQLSTVDNAVRFVWWGAEELGQIGSNHYVETLDPERLLDIALYLNFDMLASRNGGYFVFDGDDGPEGSAPIAALLENLLAAQGVRTERVPLRGGYDHMPFVEAGIPVGGLYTGATGIKSSTQAALWGGAAGLAYDPCYHSAIDDLTNVDSTMLANNTAAVARVIGAAASGAAGVPPRTRRAANRAATA
jgi:Zn-dependent M28 family amino/carboxypeptidase